MPVYRNFRPRALPSLLASIGIGTGLCMGSGAARAETSPYYIGVSAGANYDSNVFRLPTASGDKSASIGLLGGIDQPIGRQRVYASGNIRNNRYDKLTQLDNTSYGVNAGLDWSTIEKLSGTVSLAANSGLFNYGGSNTTALSERNIERSFQAIANVQYGMASLLSLTGGLTHRSLSYSDPAYQGNGLTQDVVSAGVNYRPSSGVTLGTGLRVTRGEYANDGGNFTRKDIDLTGTYIPSGLSTLNARLSYGRQNVEGAASGRDFSGATGYLSWAYQLSGKLQFNTWISRDTGAESSFFNFTNGQQGRGVGDNSQITNTLALDAIYSATGKIRVTAGVRTAHRTLANTGLNGSDTVNGATLGATYAPTRNIQLSCNAGYEKRSASGDLTAPYSARTIGCSGQITLQ